MVNQPNFVTVNLVIKLVFIVWTVEIKIETSFFSVEYVSLTFVFSFSSHPLLWIQNSVKIWSAWRKFVLTEVWDTTGVSVCVVNTPKLPAVVDALSVYPKRSNSLLIFNILNLKPFHFLIVILLNIFQVITSFSYFSFSKLISCKYCY